LLCCKGFGSVKKNLPGGSGPGTLIGVAPSEKIKVARYYIGEVAVELMESTAPDGEVAKYIERKGEGFFLISYKVDDLPKAMQELKDKNVKLIDNKPRELFGNRYAFIHHPNKLGGVLTELIDGEFDINKQG
jgi:methylmalonyl-CoA/ethylmalonyl-CoA epimerase